MLMFWSLVVEEKILLLLTIQVKIEMFVLKSSYFNDFDTF